MNRNNLQTRARQALDAARNLGNKAAAVGTGLMVTAGSAMAGASDPGAAITSEITSGKTTVNGILIVLAGVLGLFLLWSMIKRAK